MNKFGSRSWSTIHHLNPLVQVSSYDIKRRLATIPLLRRSLSYDVSGKHEDQSTSSKAYIALGSNLGDRIRNIETACHELNHIGLRVLRTSSLYETAPMYVEEQASFINGVCEVTMTTKPISLRLDQDLTVYRYSWDRMIHPLSS